MKVDELLGDGFEQKLVEAAKRARRRFILTETAKQEILDMAKKHIKPDNPAFNYGVGTNLYHVILVKSLNEIQKKKLNWGDGISFRYRDGWVSVAMPEEQSAQINPNTYYLLIGYMKPKTVGAKTYLNFTCHAVIELD
jgi:hypothetical protein